VADAFYLPEGERFASTELTRGPWDEESQHAGPPAALLARELERCGEPRARRVGRVTIEILGPVPIAPLTAAARVVRPGRGVELVEGELAGPEGPVMSARAWRLRAEPVELPDGLPVYPPPPGPESGRPTAEFPSQATVGWHTAMEIRFVAGDYLEPGPATAWFRPRHRLVAGEETSPLARVLLAADAGNGVSATLDWSRFRFVNVDLTVHLARPPRGEWVCLDAVTVPEADGTGLAESALHDEQGRIGLAAQTLVIRPRTT
jgi:Acyl-CoA thioesterase C-terminal domain/Acyl-CoA thioesterase N-terminal domain